ncbi:LysR family transcriptional regulator [Pseudomonas sp. G11-1]|uniref:DNA-binding transcriptional regulator, LysR family n=1 Tax=Halopseudomonas bauzanensis TaxID=653930 RepID=A0A1I4LTA7_9GAMM|nr:LysR family transcriptional regulator [Halopseudomonas bauzanensis]MCO5786979.1 LysR family transcriptional regulator [Pseudomonas sp. G11-1]MCO5790205.1 LysR family transcriptional regulator [Pseudomonas sp. G11-2]SER86402.1 DNA-binding transcriptional regulator, LysR family [Halopseudomonas bauzanensis]SFL94272.1 DNA-binding transcriptional regulator, LysR family [Halopseudomonas bauzanensis]
MRKELHRITLRQLQVFRSLCATLSYSRTAEEMALTQPAVSLQMRQLEELVGQPLFEYVGRKLYLTDAATILLAASGDIFNRLEILDMQLSALQGTLHGELRLAVASSIQYLTPHLLAAFRQRHPEVSFRLEVSTRAEVIRRLRDNLDDVVLVGMVPADRALDFFPFLNNPVIAVAAPDHPLAARQQLGLAELESQMVLVREIGSGVRKACDEFFQQKRVHLQRVMQMGSGETVVQSAIAGLGIGLVSAHSAAPWLRNGQLARLDFTDLPLFRSWCAVHARGKRLSPVAEAFLAFLREERALIKQLAEPFS